ncbi:TetR/AcrR family transcriptional regulator [Rhodovarius crocodyli]|uniref:TetR/AcrR family transcriptional regulator n=1 Tax=Rhodovarius crocodyli TaxID=1979269 RepID=A0A437MED4_9PROT|nr:TetR/AcrR family transcriptional regulator [Rhodovarius crocodyli]RVT95959.1 TetR/AcrR family transcriptional regulator [Rhodovarius crocodyli]
MHKSESKPRGRPRAFDREAALAKATRLFWEKGYEATSISDLTEALGIGPTSLYAAFGSKEALYSEALEHYARTYDCFVWTRFRAAQTARDAIEAFLMDSAASFTGCAADMPRGCMVTLSSVGSEGHEALGRLIHDAREEGRARLERRLRQAVSEGELPEATDVTALARFYQTVQSGMSLLARDGAGRAELEQVARLAMVRFS